MKYSLKTDSKLHAQFVFTTAAQAIQWGKESFSTNGAEQLDVHIDKINFDATSYHTPNLIMNYTPK